ncbi:MAG TPA: tetratricopeptide repeat protein [bacterium]|nr:tetratricopeptide repeat protein [bacterium]
MFKAMKFSLFISLFILSSVSVIAIESPAFDDPFAQEDISGISAREQGEGAEDKPVSDKELMFMDEGMQLEQKQRTREQIEADVRDLYEEGMKYYRIEDYEGAIEIWSRIIQNFPTAKNLYDIRYSLANAYEFARKYDKAIQEYQKVLAEKPKHELAVEAAYRLAGCYARIEKWNFAHEIYRDIIARAPDDKSSIRAYFNIAVIYLRQEKFKRAERIYRNIIRHFPNTGSEIQARFQLASMLAQTNRYKSSINEYKLIKFKYKDTEWAPRAAMGIGDTYRLSGDLKNAKDAYSRVIYEFFREERYVQMAEERINSLKYHREIESKVYGN